MSMSPNATSSPLVFLHGSGESAHAWDGVIARLPEWDCLALDLPGRGAARAEDLPAHLDVGGYAQLVQSELARRGLASVCLIGHSLGSAVALRLAEDDAALVSRLVLVGAGARLRVLPELLALAATSPDTALRQLMETGFAPTHSTEAAAYFDSRAPVGPATLLRDLAACDSFDMMAEVPRVSQPALVVVGEHDRLTPPKYAAYLRDHLPEAQLVMIADAGHYLNAEAPAALADAIRSWLRS